MVHPIQTHSSAFLPQITNPGERTIRIAVLATAILGSLISSILLPWQISLPFNLTCFGIGLYVHFTPSFMTTRIVRIAQPTLVFSPPLVSRIALPREESILITRTPAPVFRPVVSPPSTCDALRAPVDHRRDTQIPFMPSPPGSRLVVPPPSTCDALRAPVGYRRDALIPAEEPVRRGIIGSGRVAVGHR